jgi:hypothetical protein
MVGRKSRMTTETMQCLLTRVLLLLAYAPLSLAVGVVFAGGGHGSYAPSAVMYAWGILPWQFGIAPEMIGFWLVPMAYLVGFFGVMSYLAPSPHRLRSLMPFIFHAVGVMVALVKAEHGDSIPAGFLAASYIVPAVLAGGYLWCDWNLARRPYRSLPTSSPPIHPS